MRSPFAEYEELVSDLVDDTFAEQVEIVPTVTGGYTKAARDLSRTKRTITAVVDFNPIIAQPKFKGEYDGFRPDVNAERVHISATERQLGPETDWPVAGDILVLLDRGHDRYAVVAPQPDGLGRVVFICRKAS